MKLPLLLLVVLAFIASAYATHPDCDYSAVYSSCGGDCSLDMPSGSCEFDECRFCCINSECPGYFDHACEDSGSDFEGGGHCEGGAIDVCSVGEICTSAVLSGAFVTLSLF